MVSIAELGRPEFALHWHEAVAVVAETADTLLGRGLATVPDPASVILTPDGTLHLLDEGPPGLAPVPRLGDMLSEALSSSACPAELRQLVAGSMNDPPAYATIEAFADALAFFERPGRQDLLIAVAARTSEVELETRAHTELERLEARTRKEPRKAERTPEPTPSRKHHVGVYAVAGVLLILGVVAGALAAVRANGSTPSTLTARVRERVDRIAARGLEAVGLRTPAPPESASPLEVAATPRVRPKAGRPARKELPVTVSVRELASGPVAALPSAAGSESPEITAPDEAVYSAEAEGVEPAVLIRPHMPTRAPSDVTSEEIGILEIVVSTTGAVEQVRLISTSNRYQDRMIVAAAKAWQFEPAMKDGQPVRYRTQIRITL